MKVCILGNNLISLVLAKTLANQGIFVDFFFKHKKTKINKTSTLGISKSNVEFFNKNILNIKKLLWKINKIEIYSDNLKNEKLINFNNKNEHLFSIIKNFELQKCLLSNIKKNKLINFKKNFTHHNLIKDDYNLIFNCDFSNFITKKYFSRKIEKNYDSYAYTTIIKHKNLPNNIAKQIFTKKGPFAFLPVSNTETSIVFSVRNKKNLDLKDYIKKYNSKYSIIKIYKIAKFELKSSNLRSYCNENILAFGDMLHRLHPLAGQGFNMSIRDIKEILKIIKKRLDYGLELDKSVLIDFEKKVRHKNYLFSNGIDFIYEFFKLESKISSNILSKSIQLLGKNKIANNFFTKSADYGII